MKNSPPTAAAHSDKGLQSILRLNYFYDLWQNISGADSAKHFIFKNHIPLARDDRLLDIGCGTGSILNLIDPALDIAYTGCDMNPNYIAQATRRFGHRARFVCSTVNELLLEEGDFNAILAVGILHHLDDDEAAKLLLTAASKLAPGGHVYMIEPVRTEEQGFVERFLMNNDRGKNIKSAGGYEQLARQQFASVETTIFSGLMFIPWTVCLIKASR